MNTSFMEPMMPEEARQAKLVDLATELLAKSSALTAKLPLAVQTALGDCVRSMNCYYSNLIEGHNTHPRDIERALNSDFSHDQQKRALQLEAKAHIEVQRLIDERQQVFSVSAEYICWLHKVFGERLPESLLTVVHPTNSSILPVLPGKYRTEWVQVGRHVAPAPEEIAFFLERFEQAYRLTPHNKIKHIISAAASHHRLLWIHPFLDGNGRVARLFSHAFLSELGIGSSLWSVSRGLARHVNRYKECLMAADQPRQGDLDGCGNLSARGLETFCEFFLETCLDQIEFMAQLIAPQNLLERIQYDIEIKIQKGELPRGSFLILREALFSGEIERGKAATITGYQERQARTILSALLKEKFLTSKTPKGPVSLNFPASVLETWFPRLFLPSF